MGSVRACPGPVLLMTTLDWATGPAADLLNLLNKHHPERVEKAFGGVGHTMGSTCLKEERP